MKGLIGTWMFLTIALKAVQGAPQYSNHGYQGNPSNYLRPVPGYGGNPSNYLRPVPGYGGNPSNYLRPVPGYGGNPSNHVRPWGYGGPPSHHTRPYPGPQDHFMSFGQPISTPGKVMIDSEGNYQSNEMGLYGSASYPSSGNVRVLPRNEMYSGHSGHSGSNYPSSGNVQVLPINNHGYSGNPSNHLRPWGSPGYGGNPGQHLRPWQGRQGGNKVEVLPMGGLAGGQSMGEELPPVQQAPLPPINMAQTPISDSQPSMGMSQPSMGMSQPSMGMSQPSMVMSQLPMSMPQPSMGMSQPSMGMYRPSMGMAQPLNWRKSYQPIPGTGNCYNRCKNRCGGSSQYSGYSGCRRPTCSNRCNIQPTCGGRRGSMAQPGNFQVSGNTLLCGTRRQGLQRPSPWIPGFPNPNPPPFSSNVPPFSPAQTLPHPIKFAEVPENVEDVEDVEGIATDDEE